jgi:hypothetical protein
MQSAFLLRKDVNGDVCAVIRMRDADLLCADFDLQTRQLTGDLQILKAEGTSRSLRETGRLKSPGLAKKAASVPVRG